MWLVWKTRIRAFTVLELLVSVMVIAILAGLIAVTVTKVRARAERVQCTNNLRNLAVAANLFVQQHGSWPQIPSGESGTPTEQFAEAWIAALAPFGADRKTWICPTIQKSLKNRDYLQPENARLDYVAMTFDDKPTSPHRWPRQPWFIERGDVHGSGNLIIFTDGSISDVKTVLENAPKP